MEILKIVFLFLGVWLSLVNIAKTLSDEPIYWWCFILQAIGITGFVYMQFLMPN